MYLDQFAKKSRYEQHIKHIFGAQNIRFTGTSPIFETPLILIGFTNRSGSNLLCDYLRQTGRIQGLGEMLNYPAVRKLKHDHALEDFPSYFQFLTTKFCPNRECLGVKASCDQLASIIRNKIPEMFPETYVINIERRDKIAQAVSYSIALQTKKWTSAQAATGTEPVFKLEQIDRLISAQKLENEMIALQAQAFKLPFCKVDYESLCDDPKQVISTLFEFAGIELPKLEISTPKISRQADERNLEFVELYLEAIRKQHRSAKKHRLFDRRFFFGR